MKALSLLRLTTVAALTLNLSAAPAQAVVAHPATAPLAVPTLWDAEGDYTLQDGRNLSLRVRGQDLLVSADGQRRMHLHRDRSGRVQRVTLEAPRR